MSMKQRREMEQFKSSIAATVKALSKKNVEVTQRGSHPGVTRNSRGKIISVNIPTLPDDASPDLIKAIRGFIDMKVAEILFTSDDLPKGMLDFPLFKIVENTRIESEVNKLYPGSVKNIRDAFNFVVKKSLREKMDAAGDLDGKIAVALDPYIHAKAGSKSCSAFVAEELDTDIVAALDARIGDLCERIPFAKDSREAYALAKEINERLHNPAPDMKEETPAQDEQQEDEQEQEEQQEQGQQDKEQEQEQKETEAPAEAPQNDEEAPQDEAEGNDTADSEEAPKQEAEAEQEKDEQKEEGSEEHQDEGKSSEADQEGAQETEETGEDERLSGENEDDEEGSPDAETEGQDSEGISSTGEDEQGSEGAEQEEASAGETSEQTDGTYEQTEATPGDIDDGGDYAETASIKELPVFDDLEPQCMEDDLAEVISQEAVTSSINNFVDYSKDYDAIRKPNCRAVSPTAFRRFKDEATPLILRMTTKMRRLLAAKSDSLKYGGFRSGKLNSSALYRLAVGDNRVFYKKVEHKTTETAVTLLIDCSGSMSGNPMRIAMQSAYVFAEVLNRLNINFEVLGFTAIYADYEKFTAEEKREYARLAAPRGPYTRISPITTYEFKSFNDKYSDEERRGIFSASRGDGIVMNENLDGSSVQVALNRLAKQSEERKILFVFSDGQPASAYEPDRILRAHLRGVVQEAEKDGFEIIGVGINSNAVKSYYKNHVVVRNIKKLPEVTMRELEKILLK